MPTNPTDSDMTPDEMDRAVESARDILRRRADELDEAKASQPERLAKARSDAEEARGWALLEEPLAGQVKSIDSIDGQASLTLPNMVAKELWGARLAFDLLDCGDDYEEIDAVTARLFAAAGGDTGVMMLIQAAALSTIAALIVPQFLQEIEIHGSNWDERVRLCEARAKAWHGRADKLREHNDEDDQ